MHVQAWQRAYRGIVPDAYLDALNAEERIERWRGELSGPLRSRGSVLVAVSDHDDADVLGFVSTGPTRDEDIEAAGHHEVYAIYVATTWWGRRIGTSLMGSAVASVPRPGQALVLWVLAGNERGRRFYERFGFRADGATKTVDIGGRALDELRYRLATTPTLLQGPADR